MKRGKKGGEEGGKEGRVRKTCIPNKFLKGGGEVYNCDRSETRARKASSQSAEKLLLHP